MLLSFDKLAQNTKRASKKKNKYKYFYQCQMNHSKKSLGRFAYKVLVESFNILPNQSPVSKASTISLDGPHGNPKF